jgi:hypothetical protein
VKKTKTIFARLGRNEVVILVFILAFLFLPAFISLRKKTLKAPEVNRIETQVSPAPAQAVLLLEPSQTILGLGQTFSLKAWVEVANGEATGVEAMLVFDPNFLQVVRVSETGFFDEYLVNKVNNQAGKIVFSGINWKKRFKSGIIGEILFRSKKKGQTEVKFIFSPGETMESDVTAPGGKDILSKTLGTKVMIK